MNILSFTLAIAAIVVFLSGYRGLKWGSIGLGLALLTTAYIIQLVWSTSHIITVS